MLPIGWVMKPGQKSLNGRAILGSEGIQQKKNLSHQQRQLLGDVRNL